MNVAVVGYGVEGHSSYEYWHSRGDDVTIHDANVDLELPGGMKSVLGPHYLDELDRYDLVVRTPGLLPRRFKTSAQVTTATREFFEQCSAPIIGVTGTKGKGTTSSIITSILREAGRTLWLGGNIGTPMLDFLPKVQPDDLVVLELSSFQLIDLQKSPHVAVHLMMDVDHLDTHKDFEEYQTAKANIFRFQKPDDIAVYIATNKFSCENVQMSPAATCYSVSIEPTVEADTYVKDNAIYFHDTKIMDTKDIPLLGRFNQENVCAAVAAVWSYVKDPAVIRSGVMKFHGLPHRMQLIAEHDGVRYIDDSIAVNPTAALAAMASFSEPLIVVVGGKDKKVDYAPFVAGLIKKDPKKILLLGEIADRLHTSLQEKGYQSAEVVHEMDVAVRRAADIADRGDVVLLAPGTSSFDMYKDFAARGDEFDKAVLSLGAST